ncbi:MAG TPA: OmpA family protein, partial [Polyangiaceae bacterium]|nr:OmpA family protein [Polyangiaceae bacterium]
MMDRGTARVLAFGAALALLAAGNAARAQSAPSQNAIAAANSNGFDTHLFRPAMDSKGLFTVNGTDILGAKDFSLGLVLDLGHNLLRTTDPDHGRLIDYSFQGTLQFNYGIANQVVVGIDLPVDLTSGGQLSDTQSANTYANKWGPQQLDFQGPAYIAAHAKWRITKVEHGFGLAVGLEVGDGFLTAAANAQADPGFWYWPQLMIERRFGSTGQFRLAANGGFRGHLPSDTTLPLREGNFKDGNLFTYGGGVSWRVLESLDLVAETYGTYLLQSDAGTDVKPSNEVVGGIKLFTQRNSYLMIGGGARYTGGFEAADSRVFLGFIFEPSIGDRDGDGIKDDVDKCPDDPEDFDGFQDADG